MPIREDLHKLSTLTEGLAAIVVVPKPAFVDWLTDYLRSERLLVRNKSVHGPLLDSVWLIPPTDLCSHGELMAFVNEWKPAMLLAELENHGVDRSRFSYEISAKSFDVFFEACIKHDALPITFISRLRSGENL